MRVAVTILDCHTMSDSVTVATQALHAGTSCEHRADEGLHGSFGHTGENSVTEGFCHTAHHGVTKRARIGNKVSERLILKYY